MFLVTHPQGRDQGTDPDPCGPQIVDLIDLKDGINLAGSGKDIAYLVCGYGIQAAAEGI